MHTSQQYYQLPVCISEPASSSMHTLEQYAQQYYYCAYYTSCTVCICAYAHSQQYSNNMHGMHTLVVQLLASSSSSSKNYSYAYDSMHRYIYLQLARVSIIWLTTHVYTCSQQYITCSMQVKYVHNIHYYDSQYTTYLLVCIICIFIFLICYQREYAYCAQYCAQYCSQYQESIILLLLEYA